MAIGTREQRFARSVYDRVSKVAAKSETEKKEYGSLAHRLPVLIRTAGLAQALAFADARGTKAGQRALQADLAAVLNHREFAGLAAYSRSVPLDEYLWLTQETLAALLWFKRYAQSVLKVEGGDDGESQTAGA